MTLEKVACLQGHTNSVLCCATNEHQQVLSGGEDGALCLFDLRTAALAHRLQLAAEDEAVPSVAFHPGGQTVYAAVGTSVQALDLRKLGSDDSVELHQYQCNSDEVNQVAVNPKGTFLAAADDAGEVAVINLATSKLHKRLRGGHENLCSSVAFRTHRPWELVSGGLDSCTLLWDFSRGRTLRSWQPGDEDVGGSKVCNPPLVHAVAVPTRSERTLQGFIAAARGDGAVALYNADAPSAHRHHSQKPVRGGARLTATRRSTSGDQVVLLSRADGGHTAAVSHLVFTGPSDGLLLTGGNDGRLIVWNWLRAALPSCAAAQDAGALVAHSRWHGKKVNWISCAQEAGGAQQTIVADTSTLLSVYSMRR